MATRIPASSPPPSVPLSVLLRMVRASFAMRASPTDGWALKSIVSLGLDQISHLTQQVSDGVDRRQGAVGELLHAGWCLGPDDGDAQRANLAVLTQELQGPERMRVRLVITHVHDAVESPLGHKPAYGRTLGDAERRQHV